MIGPGYWKHAAGGRLRPAIQAYLHGERLDERQIAAIRAYLKQWIEAPVWRGDGVDDLRRRIDELTSRQTIRRWLEDAYELEIDPL